MSYLDGKAADAEKSTAEAHLAGCRACAELKQELEEVVHQLGELREELSSKPPADVVDAGIQLFQAVRRPKKGGVRQIIASLVYDSFDQAMPAGVRRVGAPPRQLLFRAGDVDVDVMIESTEASGRITLAGQIFSNAVTFFDNTPVKLESRGIVRYRIRTNAVGEFSFDQVPADTYHLSVDLPEGQITLCVAQPNSRIP